MVGVGVAGAGGGALDAAGNALDSGAGGGALDTGAGSAVDATAGGASARPTGSIGTGGGASLGRGGGGQSVVRGATRARVSDGDAGCAAAGGVATGGASLPMELRGTDSSMTIGVTAVLSTTTSQFVGSGSGAATCGRDRAGATGASGQANVEVEARRIASSTATTPIAESTAAPSPAAAYCKRRLRLAARCSAARTRMRASKLCHAGVSTWLRDDTSTGTSGMRCKLRSKSSTSVPVGRTARCRGSGSVFASKPLRKADLVP